MKRQSVRKLKEAVRDVLYGGGGDPGRTELIVAAEICKVLEAEGHKIADNGIVRTLSGENVYNHNYLAGLGYKDFKDD